MPSVVSMRNWCASTYHGCAPFSCEAQRGEARAACARQAGCGHDAGVDRLEPALEAAVQRVVFDRLPVRAVRHQARPPPPSTTKHGVPAAPVAAAVAQVGVGRQVVPRRPQRVERGERRAGEAREAGRREHRVAALARARPRARRARVVGARRTRRAHRP